MRNKEDLGKLGVKWALHGEQVFCVIYIYIYQIEINLVACALLSEDGNHHDMVYRRLCKKPSVATTAVHEPRDVV